MVMLLMTIRNASARSALSRPAATRRRGAGLRNGRSRTSVRSIWAMVLALVLGATAPLGHASADPVDLVLLVDDSTAVKSADPNRELRDALADFIRLSRSETHVSIISFDDLPFPVAPLTPMTTPNRGELLDALGELDFATATSNLSAGLEMAIYELSRNGRDDAEHRIVLVLGGEINTGDFERDQAFRRWATEVLANKAAQKSIAIGVISFGELADVDLAAEIAEITGGGHLHLNSSAQLAAAFADLGERLLGAPLAGSMISKNSVQDGRASSTAAHPEKTAHTDPESDRAVVERPWTSEPRDALAQTYIEQVNRITQAEPPQAGIDPASNTVPTTAQRPVDDRADAGPAASVVEPVATGAARDSASRRILAQALADPGRSMLWIAVGVLTFGLIVAFVAFLRARSRGETSATHHPTAGGRSEVKLIDVSGISGHSTYTITGKLVRVCRTPGRDSDNVVCLSIPDDVISREHAFIEYRDGGYFVTDRDSDNGTFVNGRRVQDSRRLKSGDRIQFATFEFVFEASGPMAAGSGQSDTAADETVIAPVGDATAVAAETVTPSGGLTLVHDSGAVPKGRATDADDRAADGEVTTDKPDLSDRTLVR